MSRGVSTQELSHTVCGCVVDGICVVVNEIVSSNVRSVFTHLAGLAQLQPQASVCVRVTNSHCAGKLGTNLGNGKGYVLRAGSSFMHLPALFIPDFAE